MNEADYLRSLVVKLVEAARTSGVTVEELADLFDDDSDPVRMNTGEGVLAELDRICPKEEEKWGQVMVSRDWIAENTGITPQGVSHLCKVGHLEGRKVRVDGRIRMAVTFKSVIDYFDIPASTQARFMRRLVRQEAGQLSRNRFMTSRRER